MVPQAPSHSKPSHTAPNTQSIFHDPHTTQTPLPQRTQHQALIPTPPDRTTNQAPPPTTQHHSTTSSSPDVTNTVPILTQLTQIPQNEYTAQQSLIAYDRIHSTGTSYHVRAWLSPRRTEPSHDGHHGRGQGRTRARQNPDVCLGDASECACDRWSAIAVS